MRKRRRKRRNDIVTLASELEAAQAEFLAAQQRVASLKQRMIAQLGARPNTISAPSRRNGAPARTRRRNAKKVDWETARKTLLSAMKNGARYEGAELQRLSGLPVSAPRFIANVRDPLLSGKALKKVTIDGKPWRKGMSPRSVRWMKSS